jgi:hypothetical protein
MRFISRHQDYFCPNPNKKNFLRIKIGQVFADFGRIMMIGNLPYDAMEIR